MKNKKMIYVLIVCVTGLWGGIFCQVFAGFSDDQDEEVSIVATGKKDYLILVDHSGDTSGLDLKYRDPFSVADHNLPVEIKAPKENLPAAAFPPIIKPHMNWSGIQYSGYVTNPGSKQRIAVVMINGKDVLLCEGQSLSGVKLLKFDGDSIKLAYGHEIKYISIR